MLLEHIKQKGNDKKSISLPKSEDSSLQAGITQNAGKSSRNFDQTAFARNVEKLFFCFLVVIMST